jgi:hypothetical protein
MFRFFLLISHVYVILADSESPVAASGPGKSTTLFAIDAQFHGRLCLRCRSCTVHQGGDNLTCEFEVDHDGAASKTVIVCNDNIQYNAEGVTARCQQ